MKNFIILIISSVSAANLASGYRRRDGSFSTFTTTSCLESTAYEPATSDSVTAFSIVQEAAEYQYGGQGSTSTRVFTIPTGTGDSSASEGGFTSETTAGLFSTSTWSDAGSFDSSTDSSGFMTLTPSVETSPTSSGPAALTSSVETSTGVSSGSATLTSSIGTSTSSGLVSSGTTSLVPTEESTAPVGTATPLPITGFTNGVYFTNWGVYGPNYQPQDLPTSDITRVFYAFANILSDGTVKSSDPYADLEMHYPTDSWNDVGNNAYGVVKQMYILKKNNRHLKVLLSIGGATYGPNFSPAVATAAGRQNFASSALQLVMDWGFDGIDIDWEYPATAADAQNFVLLLQACRNAFDAYSAQQGLGYHFLITVASPAGPANYQLMNLAGMDPYIDSWNLMAYDYAGSWDSTTGHGSNLYADPANPLATKFNTDQAVVYYLGHGVSPRKLSMGLPLYGRSFEDTAGPPGEAYSGVGPGDSGTPGIWLYRDLPRAGAQVVYDSAVGATYSYDPAAMELITYDDGPSAAAKAQYVLAHGMGGAFFWEASGDKAGAGSLVAAMAADLGGLDASLNNLAYPTSQYDNIRNGMPGA